MRATRRIPRPRQRPHLGNARTRQVTDPSGDARAPEHPMTDIHTATRTRPADAPRPRVVSVLSQKGGTVKTTLSCAFAPLGRRSRDRREAERPHPRTSPPQLPRPCRDHEDNRHRRGRDCPGNNRSQPRARQPPRRRRRADRRRATVAVMTCQRSAEAEGLLAADRARNGGFIMNINML